SVFTFVQVIVVGLVLQHNWPVWAAIGVAMVAAAVVGLVNGITIARFRISSFVVTLATGSLLTGVMLAYSSGQTTFAKAPTPLTRIARGELLGVRLPIFYVVVLAFIIGGALLPLPIR